jgi:hypothetical protein
MSKKNKLSILLKSIVKESIKEYFEETGLIREIKSFKGTHHNIHDKPANLQPNKSIYDGRNLNLNMIKNIIKEDNTVDELSRIDETAVDEFINNMVRK